jgi:hypothetical protein
METVLSWEAEAMYDLARTVGDHATSRTQSPWIPLDIGVQR